jgi:hypothetical protein
MKKTLLVVVIILISSGIVYLKAEEKYIRKELISFTWGDGEYQLGSNWKRYFDEKGNYIGSEDARSHATGPSCIRVDKKGRLFIWDPENSRIVIFDENGNFLKKFTPTWISNVVDFDDKNTLYMVIETFPLLIQKYNQELEIIEEFYCERPLTKKFGFGGSLKMNLEKKHGWVYELIGEDRVGNIFLLMNISDIVKGKGKEVVHKYSSKGDFLVEIDIDQDDRIFAAQEEGGRFLDVDDKGNIYHLWIRKEGPKLIKWEKVK